MAIFWGVDSFSHANFPAAGTGGKTLFDFVTASEGRSSDFWGRYKHNGAPRSAGMKRNRILQFVAGACSVRTFVDQSEVATVGFEPTTSRL
jgi:hypothetical protein